MDSKIKTQVDKCPFDTLWLIVPPGKIPIEGLESLGLDIMNQLSLYGISAKTFSIQIVADPNGKKAFGVSIGFATNPFVATEVLLNGR